MRWFLVTFLLAAVGVSAIAGSEDGPEQSPQVAPHSAARWTSYEYMHEHSVGQFVKSERFDPSRIVDPKMRAVTAEGMNSILIGSQRFSIKRLELIGIAKHEQPVLFRHPNQSEHLLQGIVECFGGCDRRSL